MGNFFEVVTFGEIAISFAAACVLTVLIRGAFGGFRFLSVYGSMKVNYDRRNIKGVLKNCYELFPRDIITFRGNTFKRGSIVKIQTVGDRYFTGELVGANSENIICLVTSKHIIAHELSQVRDITLLDAAADNGGKGGSRCQ